MVTRLAEDYRNFVRLVGEYDAGSTTANRKQEIAVELRTIGERSHTENFTRMVEVKLSEWRE
jgi:hypothetical protein